MKAFLFLPGQAGRQLTSREIQSLEVHNVGGLVASCFQFAQLAGVDYDQVHLDFTSRSVAVYSGIPSLNEENRNTVAELAVRVVRFNTLELSGEDADRELYGPVLLIQDEPDLRIEQVSLQYTSTVRVVRVVLGGTLLLNQEWLIFANEGDVSYQHADGSYTPAYLNAHPEIVARLQAVGGFYLYWLHGGRDPMQQLFEADSPIIHELHERENP
jgi:hypothetical protein